MAASDVELLRRAWEAFSHGDVSAAAAVLDPQVRWYGAGDPTTRAPAMTATRRWRSSAAPSTMA